MMAHAAPTIIPARVDVLTFRRADGTRSKFYFDNTPVAVPSLRVASSGSGPGSGSGSDPASASGSGPRTGLGADRRHGNNVYQHNFYHSHHSRRPTALPRNVMRPFRGDDDEPASDIFFLGDVRQSVCRDGRDRSRCLMCRQPIWTRGLGSSMSAAVSEPASSSLSPPASPSTDGPAVSPARVFRDLLMSDVAEPLPPALRDALLATFNAGVRPMSTFPWPSSPATTFHSFGKLPYEIRRMIWEMALPSRVLLRDDLGPTTYRSVRRVFRPAAHTHSVEELWRSDLFYTCVEARRVVEAFARDRRQRVVVPQPRPGPASASDRKPDISSSPPPMVPLVMTVSSRAKLRAGHDVLYFPWLGSNGARDGNGRRGSSVDSDNSGNSGNTVNALDAPDAPDTSDTRNNTPPAARRPESSSARLGLGPPWMTRFDGAAASWSSHGNSSIGPFPLAAIPYGYWASQLRILRLPVTSVALDAAWIDKAHADTLLWASGVDLSVPNAPPASSPPSASSPSPSRPPPAPSLMLPPLPCPPCPPPTALQLVVADIILPVRIRLDRCPTSAQRRLLVAHVLPQSSMKARMPPLITDTVAAEAAARSGEGSRINLNGMDLSALVGLYDDRRIAEMLSLASDVGGDDADASAGPASSSTASTPTASTPTPSVPSAPSTLPPAPTAFTVPDALRAPVNKAAGHRCIACTRRAWEARDAHWETRFGSLLGAHLRRLCRPTVLFTVVLVFDAGDA